jgi:hypothetical protein
MQLFLFIMKIIEAPFHIKSPDQFPRPEKYAKSASTRAGFAEQSNRFFKPGARPK